MRPGEEDKTNRLGALVPVLPEETPVAAPALPRRIGAVTQERLRAAISTHSALTAFLVALLEVATGRCAARLIFATVAASYNPAGCSSGQPYAEKFSEGGLSVRAVYHKRHHLPALQEGLHQKARRRSQLLREHRHGQARPDRVPARWRHLQGSRKHRGQGPGGQPPRPEQHHHRLAADGVLLHGEEIARRGRRTGLAVGSRFAGIPLGPERRGRTRGVGQGSGHAKPLGAALRSGRSPNDNGERHYVAPFPSGLFTQLPLKIVLRTSRMISGDRSDRDGSFGPWRRLCPHGMMPALLDERGAWNILLPREGRGEVWQGGRSI
jgi:hypothetical protein